MIKLVTCTTDDWVDFCTSADYKNVALILIYCDFSIELLYG